MANVWEDYLAVRLLNAHLTTAFKRIQMPLVVLSVQKIGQPSFSRDINLRDSNTHQGAI